MDGFTIGDWVMRRKALNVRNADKFTQSGYLCRIIKTGEDFVAHVNFVYNDKTFLLPHERTTKSAWWFLCEAVFVRVCVCVCVCACRRPGSVMVKRVSE